MTDEIRYSSGDFMFESQTPSELCDSSRFQVLFCTGDITDPNRDTINDGCRYILSAILNGDRKKDLLDIVAVIPTDDAQLYQAVLHNTITMVFITPIGKDGSTITRAAIDRNVKRVEYYSICFDSLVVPKGVTALKLQFALRLAKP